MGGGEAVERDNKQDALKWDKNCFYIKKALKKGRERWGYHHLKVKRRVTTNKGHKKPCEKGGHKNTSDGLVEGNKLNKR